MVVEVSQNEEIFGGKKGVNPAIRQRANRGSINIKK